MKKNIAQTEQTTTRNTPILRIKITEKNSNERKPKRLSGADKRSIHFLIYFCFIKSIHQMCFFYGYGTKNRIFFRAKSTQNVTRLNKYWHKHMENSAAAAAAKKVACKFREIQLERNFNTQTTEALTVRMFIYYVLCCWFVNRLWIVSQNYMYVCKSVNRSAFSVHRMKPQLYNCRVKHISTSHCILYMFVLCIQFHFREVVFCIHKSHQHCLYTFVRRIYLGVNWYWFLNQMRVNHTARNGRPSNLPSSSPLSSSFIGIALYVYEYVNINDFVPLLVSLSSLTLSNRVMTQAFIDQKIVYFFYHTQTSTPRLSYHFELFFFSIKNGLHTIRHSNTIDSAINSHNTFKNKMLSIMTQYSIRYRICVRLTNEHNNSLKWHF